ncbi:MAG TPA: hypothetical protein VF691_09000 [Cytophagaceae bacterium]|jgi:disulfide oxidoreductase YuzD
MKKIFIAIILSAAMSCERATESVNVPDPVQASFKEKYPGVSAVKWQVQHDKYVAIFNQENKEVEAEFNADGSFLKEDAD